MTDPGHSGDHRDRGAILLLVLAVAIVFSLIVLALANFVAADLRYSQIIDARAKTLSSAESGIDYAVDRLRLNQTLCATDAAAGSPVSLDGSNAAGTPLLQPVIATVAQPVNGTDTKVTCQRLDNAFADELGWSVLVTAGDQPDAIKLKTGFNREISGPIYVSNAGNIDVYAPGGVGLHVSDGDIWHGDGSACTDPPMSNQVIFDEPEARGPICTTADWDDIVSAPPLPDVDPLRTDLSALPLNNGSVFTTDTTGPSPCRVFSPAHFAADLTYSGRPLIDPAIDTYFQSGDYWFDNIGWGTLESGARVSAGHPGLLTPPSDDCANARASDPNDGGVGATFFFSGNSQLRVGNDTTGASLEMFPRKQGDSFVSIRALTADDAPYPASNLPDNLSLLRTWSSPGTVRLIVHGMVWSPTSRVVVDNFADNSETRLLGGVVAKRFWFGDTWSGSRGTGEAMDVGPAMGTSDSSDASILLTSISTLDGVTTRVEAVVEYRPRATDLDDRVAVSSFRVVD